MNAADVAEQGRKRSMPESELLTARETCALLSVARATLYRDAAAGQIPRPVRVGTKPRWRRRELLAWIAAGAPAMNRWRWDGKSEKK